MNQTESDEETPYEKNLKRFNQRHPSLADVNRKSSGSAGHRGSMISMTSKGSLISELEDDDLVKPGLAKKRSTLCLTELKTMEIDHSVWELTTAMFATQGGAARAKNAYARAKRASILLLQKGEQPDQQLQDVIESYEEGKLTWTLFVNIVQGLMQSFMFGYSLTELNIPLADIKDEFDIGDSTAGWLNAVWSLGLIPGSFLGGFLISRWGRKNFLIALDFMWILCGFLFYFAVNFYAYLLTRFLIGVTSGGVTVVVPTLLGEISPVSIRGIVGAYIQLAIVTGCLVSQFIAKWVSWKPVLALGSAPAILQLATCWMILQSPAWLMGQGKEEKAENALKRLRDRENVDGEMRIFKAALAHQGSNEKQSLVEQTFTEKLSHRVDLQKALLSMFVLFTTQQLSGVCAVFFYSASIFESSGIDGWVGSIAAGLANIVGTLVSISMIESFGRKPLLISSGISMVLSMIGLMVGLEMSNKEGTAFWQWFSVVTCCVYLVGFNIGLGSIPGFFATELSQGSELATIQSIAIAVLGVTNFLIAVGFPPLEALMGTYVYIVFCVILMIGIGFMWMYIPETAGLRVDQVIEILNGTATEKDIRQRIAKQKEEDERVMEAGESTFV